ncbi:L-type lectin-domain containing receptor kinase SIT2-like [Wolffia australiana]
MIPQILLRIAVLIVFIPACISEQAGESFVFYGFAGANLTLSGQATLTSAGLLELTNGTKEELGHAFLPTPYRLTDSSSFSTSFIFAMVPKYEDLGGHGITFALSPTVDLAGSMPSQHLGLLNTSDNGNQSNHIVAVEFDTVKTVEFHDIDDNHVGIDVNSLVSISSASAAYMDGGIRRNFSLLSGRPLRAWIEYDALRTIIEVTIAPAELPRPMKPLISASANISSIVKEETFIGFTASTGAATESNIILAWSFKLNGEAEELDLSKIPKLPTHDRRRHLVLPIALSVGIVSAVLAAAISVFIYYLRRRKYAELLEDWEKDYGPQRFSYKDLYVATRGFGEEEIVGAGGFGTVYKGVMHSTKAEIAVKKIAHESQQGMREFVSEIASMGRLRHRNLVQLLGYCRRQRELILVYDFMSNGSLDKFLFDQSKPRLSWEQRIRIIRGVAAGLLYLHSGWEQVVVHRDIKASNVLLDGELNGRLSDFGLARLYDHGTNPQTTRVVGTLGYLAPELTRTGKATTMSDVYAFGAFLLEVVCGKRPIAAHPDEPMLVDFVLKSWKKGAITGAADPAMAPGSGEDAAEIERVLVLGLLCSHPDPESRPTMAQLVQYLDGDTPLPEMSPERLDASAAALRQSEGFDEFIITFPFTSGTPSTGESLFSQSR